MCFKLFFCLLSVVNAGTNTSDSPVHAVDVIHKFAKQVGNAQLERDGQQSFARFTNKTYASYIEGRDDGFTRCGFVCLNPHVKNYGGLGNLFIGALGIQFFALSINRIAIFNNALITDLFNHPDPRQSWTPIPTTVVNGEMKDDIAGFEAINLRLPMKHFDGVRFIGSHGVPAMEAGFNNFAENNLLAKYYPTESPPVDNAFYRNTVCQGFSAWILSNMTENAKVALEKYKSNFMRTCDDARKPDLAVQLRALDDKYFSGYNTAAIDCDIACAAKKAKDISSTLDRSVCIFVTSNRLDLTDFVVKRLSELLNGNDPDEPRKFQFLSHQQTKKFVTNRTGTMHSGDIVRLGKTVNSLNVDFSEYGDIMDWLILGEAVHSQNSFGSTFIRTARLRIGNADRHIFNPLQNDLNAKWDSKTNTCSCHHVTKECLSDSRASRQR